RDGVTAGYFGKGQAGWRIRGGHQATGQIEPDSARIVDAEKRNTDGGHALRRERQRRLPSQGCPACDTVDVWHRRIDAGDRVAACENEIVVQLDRGHRVAM